MSPQHSATVRELRKVLEGRTASIAPLARLRGKMSVVLGGGQPAENGHRPQPRAKYVESVGNELLQEEMVAEQ